MRPRSSKRLDHRASEVFRLFFFAAGIKCAACKQVIVKSGWAISFETKSPAGFMALLL
jgi:acyl-CoA reductase-like NAD-dependent aldehyde dehydrogenase